METVKTRRVASSESRTIVAGKQDLRQCWNQVLSARTEYQERPGLTGRDQPQVSWKRNGAASSIGGYYLRNVRQLTFRITLTA